MTRPGLLYPSLPIPYTLYLFQGSIRVDGYDSFGVERDTTPFLEEAEEIRTGPSNG